ncbi:DUF2163 domain-containing protein [Oleomonas cavernae]|uniref:DUF2163 domain-containing protein n=1 Tax=Oleomonas cavernae TaxID=2320859 RepID=A0A418WTH9_9PROT|nr:DUF2163 domain-containing protein [Oleomonas cavernae]RJF94572.1 DUF2163 domain-containing protein [Oleomonas cavernae]
MKLLPSALAAHLAGGVTTLARCWRLTRRDGMVLGFTDHDRDLSFEAVTYRAASGFTASAMESQLGLAVSNLDVEGALAAEAITAADLAAGLYDDAEFRLFLVNWQDVAQRILLRRGHFGQVTRGRTGYCVELRGLAHRLDQTVGRLFERRCAWNLGDARCGIDLEAEDRHATLTITAVSDRMNVTASGLEAFAPGAFEHGKLSWTGGANSGLAIEISGHRAGGHLAFLLPPARPVAAGDTATITVGCDRRFATCGARFANTVNFGGFPHMPGTDFVLSYPNQGDGNDGTRLG